VGLGGERELWNIDGFCLASLGTRSASYLLTIGVTSSHADCGIALTITRMWCIKCQAAEKKMTDLFIGVLKMWARSEECSLFLQELLFSILLQHFAAGLTFISA